MTAPGERKVERAVLDAPRLPPGEIPGLDRVAQRFARGLAQRCPAMASMCGLPVLQCVRPGMTLV